MSTSEILLKEVLNTCRAKSNVSLDDWKELRKDIEDYLKGVDPDAEKYLAKRLRINNISQERKRDLEITISKLKIKLEKSQELVKIYQSREADIVRVLRSNISKREIENGYSKESDS